MYLYLRSIVYCRSCNIAAILQENENENENGLDVYVGVYFTISSDLTIAHKLVIYVAWFSSFQ